MRVGTKKWNESLSEIGWEVLAFAGMLMQVALIAGIIALVRALHRT